MKQILPILLIIFASNQLISQERISVNHEIRKVDTGFSIDKLYNKQTEKKITSEKFYELIQKNPNLPLEKFYDKYGKIIKYYYNPNATNTTLKRSGNDQPTSGALFPDFIFETIDNEVISLNDLKGKLIILRFELYADDFRFKKDEILDLDTKINGSNRQSQIESIIVFVTPKEEILRGFDIRNSNFKLIPNGDGFHDKFNILRYPTTMIIDGNGISIGTFNNISEINIEELLSK